MTYFTINDNKIRVIPGTIGNLINLEVFKISKNLLNSIPEAIGGLVNLEKLWLSDNLLTSLPDGMCGIWQMPFFLYDIRLDHKHWRILIPPRKMVFFSVLNIFLIKTQIGLFGNNRRPIRVNFRAFLNNLSTSLITPIQIMNQKKIKNFKRISSII